MNDNLVPVNLRAQRLSDGKVRVEFIRRPSGELIVGADLTPDQAEELATALLLEPLSDSPVTEED
jgi:hypothetical protein